MTPRRPPGPPAARLAALLVLAAAAGPAATRYDGDGDLEARLEVQRWRINQARHDPEAMADELQLVHPGDPDYDVCEDDQQENDFGAGPAAWAAWTARRGPLAPNARLNAACANHSLDMAQTRQFVHQSPSATFYPAGSQPWQRHLAEAYDNVVVGYYENIATRGRGATGGHLDYGGTGSQFFTDLFVDEGVETRGHRQAILNGDAREIGLGWGRTRYVAYDPGLGQDVYWTEDYVTQDFGRRDGRHFFTGTLFHDGNGNARYDEGEGAGGIEVRLFAGEAEAPWYDVSGAAGPFAVPIDGLPGGTPVTVVLVNPTASFRTLSLPVGARALGTVTLAPGETRAAGRFLQPAGADNVGFRDLAPTLRAAIARDPAGVRIRFGAMAGLAYRVESRDAAGAADWAPFATVVADAAEAQVIDPRPGPARLYRVRLPVD